MSESALPKHPLFDPASPYNQMRATVAADDKMRGYWDWLCVQVDRAEEPLPPAVPRPEGERRELTCRFSAQQGTKCSVQDALRVRAWIISEADGPARQEPSMKVFPATAEVLLVREENGTRTLGLLLEDEPHARFPNGTRCRAFLLEPAVLKRLRAALRVKEEVSDDRILVQACERGTVETSYQVASLLCAVPELEGGVQGDRCTVCFQRLPVPDGDDPFPPRAGPLQVAVVLDHPCNQVTPRCQQLCPA